MENPKYTFCREFYSEYQTSRWRHLNKTHRWFSVLNSLQNVYFGFFIF